jgi:hypothetical protein
LAGGYTRSLGEGEEEGAMTYTTEEFVRREVGDLLRGRYRGKFLCSECLTKLTLERLHTGWRKSEITRAMDKVYAAPGVPMENRASFLCAHCGKTKPCLGAPYL